MSDSMHRWVVGYGADAEWLECAHCLARSRSAELGECLWHPSNRPAAARRAAAEAARLAGLTAAREEAERLAPGILAADPDSLVQPGLGGRPVAWFPIGITPLVQRALGKIPGIREKIRSANAAEVAEHAERMC